MEDHSQAGRRRAVWRIIRSRGTDQEKLDAFTALAEFEPPRTRGRAHFDRRSAVRAGKLRRVAAGGTGR